MKLIKNMNKTRYFFFYLYSLILNTRITAKHDILFTTFEFHFKDSTNIPQNFADI